MKLASLSLLGLSILAPCVWATSPTVGEATLVIGQARIVGADGAVSTAQVGSPVRVGDKVETQAGGHVYLRFVDGANLSVRPMSRMLIESYSHNPQQPQLGAIKFKLEEGVARSITGAWGEAARERFRLNTPVAAIGVRGTDFTVRSDTERTTATVYTGAIVLAPLSNGCAQTVGPCQTSSATLLSGDMRGQMLELASRDNAPLLVANTALARMNRPSSGPAAELVVASAGRALTADTVENRHEGSPPPVKIIRTETRGAAFASLEIPTPPLPPPPVPEPPSIAQPPIPTPVAPAPVAPTPVAPVPPALPPVAQAPIDPPQAVTPVGPPQVKQLSWARFPWTPSPNAETDAFLLSFTQASEATLAKLERVGSNGAYALMQAPTSSSNSPSQNLPQETVVDFRLSQATAHLLAKASWEKSEAVAVLGGNFQVDFSRAVFQTSLALQSEKIGTQSLQSSGTILPNGSLNGTTQGVYLFGSVTTDRQEAAYAFEKLLPAGALRGTTLWGR